MKKVLFKQPEWWKAETPVLARFFQLISSAIAALSTELIYDWFY